MNSFYFEFCPETGDLSSREDERRELVVGECDLAKVVNRVGEDLVDVTGLLGTDFPPHLRWRSNCLRFVRL